MERLDHQFVSKLLRAVLALYFTMPCSAALALDTGSKTFEPVRSAIRLKDFSQAAALLQTQASAGNADAQYLLGCLYRSGLGVPTDVTIARQWITKSAEQGQADAAYALAAMIANDAEPEVATMQHWLQVAAKGGQPLAKQALNAGVQPLRFQPEKTLREAEVRQQAYWLAAQQDDVELMTLLGDASLAQAKDSFGRTALAQAARFGAVRVVQHLITSKSSVNEPDVFGLTPLMLAAGAGHGAVLSALLSAEASIDAQDSVGNTALMYAIDNNHGDVAQLLLSKNGNVRLTNSQGWTALDCAIKVGNTEFANQLRSLGLTSLRKATVASSLPSIPLQHAKADNDLYRAWPDVLIAANRSTPELFFNVTKTQSATATGPNGETPLMVAVQAGNSAVVEKLSIKDVATTANETPLSWALRHGDTAMTLQLLNKGMPPDLHGKLEDAPLLDAIRQHNEPVLQALLKAVANPESRDSAGRTALMLAASQNNMSLLSALLRSGANPDSTDKAGHTAVWHASASGADDSLRILINAKVNLDKRDSNSSTPLMAAIVADHASSAEQLLAAGASVQVTLSGTTLLMLAAAQGNEVIARRLLSSGAKLDTQNSFGDTALMLAVRNAQTAVVRSLMAAGASTQLRNVDRASALDIARNLGHKELTTLLDKGS